MLEKLWYIRSWFRALPSSTALNELDLFWMMDSRSVMFPERSLILPS